MRIFDDFPLNRRLERLPDIYAPYVGHLTDGAVLMRDGSYLAMVQLQGAAFELTSPRIRKARALAVNDLLRRLPVDQVCFHLVKHPAAPVERALECSSAYGRNMMRRYREVVLGSDLRTISWFVSLIVRSDSGGLFGGKDVSQAQAQTDGFTRLEYAVKSLMGTLSEHAPKRLGRRPVETDMPDEPVIISEIGSALRLIRTGVEWDVPETSGTLGSGVLDTSPEFGKRAFDLNIPGTPRVGAMVSLKDYPAKTRAGMFNELLEADFCFSLTQSFSYERGRRNALTLKLRESHLENTGAASEDLLKGLRQLANDKGSNKLAAGMHNLALAVFADRIEDLDANIGEAMTAISRFGGATPVKERNVWYNGAMEAQYWALLPGNDWTHCRSGQITTQNLAHLASLDGYPAGQQEGFWGRSPIRFRTRAGTAHDYVPTVDEVGHTLLTGFTGSGKTVLASFLKTAIEPLLGDTGIRLLIDKDGSNRISVEMEGGYYATFRRNEESGTAPLRFLDDAPRNRAFLHRLFSWLIERDGHGGLLPDEDHRLRRGIARQMQMPKHLRSMAGVREFLGYSAPRGAGARFEKWCRGGSMGWLLDGDTHIIDIDPRKTRLFGFDFTALLPKEGETDDGSCQAVAAVIMHQLSEYIDGRRIFAMFEECRFYLEPLARMIEDYALTGRKNELMIVLIAQQPEHILDTPIGLSLMSQCRTKIMFPNKAADRQTYVDRVRVSAQAYEQLSHGMFAGGGRRFLIWRGEDESAICDFDLSAMQDELAIMSARARTNRVLDRVKAQFGNLPTDELQNEFLAENARDLARRKTAQSLMESAE